MLLYGSCKALQVGMYSSLMLFKVGGEFNRARVSRLTLSHVQSWRFAICTEIHVGRVFDQKIER